MELIPACDVVVVGAGLVGALVARRLAEQGVEVVVVEAGAIAAGAMQRGMQLALVGTPEPYTALVQRVGEETALHVWELTRRNLGLLQATAEALEIPVRAVGSVRGVAGSEEARQLQAAAARLEAAGFAVSLEDLTDLGLLVGLQTQDDLAFDPVLLTHALLAYPGITVEYHAEVQAIEPREGGLEIWARKRYLRAQAVILAGGAHIVHLSAALAARMMTWPLQAVTFEAAPVPAYPLVLETGRVLLQPLATESRLVAWTDSTAADTERLLVQTAKQFCPQAVVKERFSGWIAQSHDGLPLVGEIPGLPGGYTVGALGPWGFSWVCVAVEALVKLMLRGTSVGLFDLGRLSTQ